MLDRDSTYNNIIDRIDRLEALVEDLRDVARPSEVVIYENAEWQALAGWVSTGSVLRSLDGEIILDPSIPMIQVGTGGYIQSEDFVTGVSGFQINGGTAEFNDVVVRGTIYADLGEIGGWVIGTYTLTADAGAVGLNSEATGGVDWRIWAGNAVPANAPFRVDESGNLVATSATITGTITATSGTIGGWTINAASLTGGDVTMHSTGYLLLGTGNDIVRLDAANATYRLWIGHATDASAPFSVTKAGAVKATSGTVGGWTLGTYTLTAGAGTVGLNSEVTGGVDWRFWAGHATPSSAPFRVDESGNLVAAAANITGTIDANAGHLGSLDVDGVITVGAVAPYIEIDGPNKRIESSTYAAGISGMQIQANGDAEFNNVRIRGALTSAVFVRDLVEARAGSMMIVKSGGVLYSDMAVPGAGTWAMTIEDPPGGGFLFENSDICRCRTEYAAGIGDIWFVVSARVDNGDGTQNYTCTYSSGTRSITYPAGAPVLDYGVSGDGGLYLTADDTNGPFIDVFTHAGAPWATLTERVRMGNLNGVGDYVADAYGIFIGDYAGDMWMSYDPTNSLRIRGDALIDGTVSAEALIMGDYDLFFDAADGLLLLGPYCELTATSWESTRGQTATISGAFHQVAGKWANSKALVVEEGTTNYIPDPVFGHTTLTDYWTNNGFDTFERSTAYTLVGGAALHLVDAAGGVSCYSATITDADGGETWTATARVWVVSGTLTMEIWENNGGWSTADGIDSQTTGQWETLTVTATLTAGVTDGRVMFSCAAAGEFYVDWVQFERRTAATSLCWGGAGTGYAWSGTAHASSSTRTMTVVNLDAHASLLSDLNTVTHSVWVQALYDADGRWPVSTDAQVFDVRGADNANRLFLSFNHSTNDRWRVYYGTNEFYANNQTFKAGDWLYLVVTANYTTDIYNLYVNGNLVSTGTRATVAPTGVVNWKLGTVYNKVDGFGAFAFGEYAVFNRVLTAEEVAALYARGKPLVDSGALTKPGIYILDGLFKLASSTTGLRTELTAAGLGVYNGAGLTSVGRVLVGMVDTTGTVLDETATDLGMFGYDAADTLQVAWYASGANAGKVMAGGDVVMLDEDGIAVEISTAAAEARAYKFLTSAGALRSGLYGYEVGSINYLLLKAEDVTGEATRVTIQADAPAGKSADVTLAAYSGARAGGLGITVDSDGDMYASTGLDLRIGDTYADGVGGGIVIGSTAVNPDKGAIHFIERSSDPTEPGEGFAVIWMSDGTGKGDDGDVLIASKAGGSTTYAILFDHSAGSAW